MTPKPPSPTKTTEPLKQEWVCEGCGLSGTVKYEAGGDVFAVFRLIRDHHERLASQHAPLCHFDADQTRVRNGVDVYAWNRLVVEIEKNCGRGVKK